MECQGPVISEKDDRRLIDCKACGYIHVQPMYTEHELEQFYENSYSESTPSYLFEEKVKTVMGHVQTGRVLDIGCWEGRQLGFFKARGWDCTGTELSKRAAEKAMAQGLKVYQISIRQFFESYREETWDVINAAYILEHIPDPAGFLRRLHGNLEDNGVLIIEVPNDFNALQSVYIEQHKTAPYWVVLPDHLNYFNKPGIERLAERTGWKVLCGHVSFPMELFLLMGDDYVSDRSLGPDCFKKVVKMEETLRTNHPETLSKMYSALYAAGLGRSLVLYLGKA